MRSWTAVQPRDPYGRSPATGQRPWSAPSMITMDDPVVRALPGMGCALRPAHASPNTKTTTVCAGHRLGGAPRRNRTGDPILTMEPPGTAVRTAVFAAHTRPSRPKLSVLFRRSYAFTSRHAVRRCCEPSCTSGRRAQPVQCPGRRMADRPVRTILTNSTRPRPDRPPRQHPGYAESWTSPPR
jgi:hypothetical protein